MAQTNMSNILDVKDTLNITNRYAAAITDKNASAVCRILMRLIDDFDDRVKALETAKDQHNYTLSVLETVKNQTVDSITKLEKEVHDIRSTEYYD